MMIKDEVHSGRSWRGNPWPSKSHAGVLCWQVALLPLMEEVGSRRDIDWAKWPIDGQTRASTPSLQLPSKSGKLPVFVSDCSGLSKQHKPAPKAAQVHSLMIVSVAEFILLAGPVC